MSRVFLFNVARLDASGELQEFTAGDPVPDWLDAHVDEHAAGTCADVPVVEDDPPQEVPDDESQGEDGLDADTVPDATPDSSWKKDDLIDWAEAYDVDLGDASTKAEIWEIIEAYLED